MKKLIVLCLMLSGCQGLFCNDRDKTIELSNKYCKCHGGVKEVLLFCTLKSSTYCMDGTVTGLGEDDYVGEEICK